MSFNVQFYSFAKEVNSSELPSGNGTVIPCVANDGVDIINPVISLQRGNGGANSPTAWNYCKIPDFNNRLYFIENWEWRGGLWHAHCAVDVLATYRTQIYAMSAYVVRSAHSFDGTISDGLYPARQLFSFNSVTSVTPWVGSIEFGTVVVGIAGSSATNYYKFTYVNFLNFIQCLLSDEYASSVTGKLGLQVYSEAKAIVDPLQYITSVIYVPFQDWSDMTVEEIQVGFGLVENYPDNPDLRPWNCKSMAIGSNSVTIQTTTIGSIPSHPWSQDRGEYFNHAPWSEYTIDVAPFGVIELDPSKFRGSISLDYHIDWATGEVILRIWGLHNTGSGTERLAEMNVLKGQLGVNIEIGQVIAKGMGILSNIQHGANLVSQVMGGITGGGGTGAMISNATHYLPEAPGASTAFSHIGMGRGAIVGGVASAASGISGWIKDAIESKIPSVNTVGTLGSFVELYSTTRVNTKFMYPVFENREQRGRPLCKTMTLGNLAADVIGTDGVYHSGYLLIADPDVKTIAATALERNLIVGFMTGGFYLA